MGLLVHMVLQRLKVLEIGVLLQGSAARDRLLKNACVAELSYMGRSWNNIIFTVLLFWAEGLALLVLCRVSMFADECSALPLRFCAPNSCLGVVLRCLSFYFMSIVWAEEFARLLIVFRVSQYNSYARTSYSIWSDCWILMSLSALCFRCPANVCRKDVSEGFAQRDGVIYAAIAGVAGRGKPFRTDGGSSHKGKHHTSNSLMLYTVTVIFPCFFLFIPCCPVEKLKPSWKLYR